MRARPRAPAPLLVVLGALALTVPLAVATPVAADDRQGKDPARVQAKKQASSASDGLVIRSMEEDELIKRGHVRVCVAGLQPGFRAIVGTREVTQRFQRGAKRGRDGSRCATLRRGRDVAVGENRLVVESGEGAARQSASRTFVVGKPARGLLRMRLKHRSQSLLHVRLAGPQRKQFESVRIRLNGKVVDTEDWVIGDRTHSSQWPVHTDQFTAMFGADDGLRHGRNRLSITAWDSNGRYDTSHVRVHVPRNTPLPSAGDGNRVPVGRTVQLDASATVDAGKTRPGRKAGRTNRDRHKSARDRHKSARDKRKSAGTTLRWEIVDAPQGSTVSLEDATTQQPSLQPDVHGTYRIRLTATADGSRSSTAAVDETTVEAKPDISPMGVPISTITDDGGIEVGGTTYPAAAGSWAQLLVLDRDTLEVVENLSVGTATEITELDLDELATAIDEHAGQLIVLSGGGRAAGIGFSDYVVLSEVFAGAGSSTLPSDARLADGAWSLIGVADVSGSAHANLYGMIYGPAAGQGGQPGAVAGYLREDTYKHYGFASGEYSTIDTQVPGTPAGVNAINVGAQTYTSDQLPAGYSGFHVLVLDSMLNRTAEETYGIDGLGDEPVDTEAADKMRLLLDSLDPGYLVIVQSIGEPFGWQTSWVNDGPLNLYSFGTNANVEVPRAPSTWYDATDTGQSLAGAIGGLGGAVAHDQLAALNSSSTGQGFTMIASTGQLEYNGDATSDSPPVPVDPASAPVSQVGGTPSKSRVVATLSRDRQALWQVGPTATDDIFATGAVREILHQQPTAWPLTDPAHQAANCYIASQMFADTGITDVREAYYEKADSDWTTEHDDLLGLMFESGATCPETSQAVTEAAFNEMKNQLLEEFLMVADVTNVTDQWKQLFLGNSTIAAYVDLQTIAHDIVDRIESIDDSDQGTVRTEKIVADSLKIAGSAFSPVPGAGVAFGVAGNTLDLVADSSSDSTGAPSLAPLEDEVATLGQELVDRYEQIAQNISQVQAILVSDYGKLQEANRLHEAWLPNTDEIGYTMEIGAKREFYSGLLPTVYGLYYVAATYIMDDSSAMDPWDLACQSEDFSGDATHPFGETDDTPDAWTTPVISTGAGPEVVITNLGISTVADIADDGTMEHNPHQPTLSSMAPSGGQGDADNLFATVESGNLAPLGMDPTTLFADSRFTTRWFWCAKH